MGKVLPNVALAGPAASNPKWMAKLSSFVTAAPRLGLVTYHRYPLRACTTDPSDPSFPSIPKLLADSSSAGLAAGVKSFVTVAGKHELPFRIGEMNSASCEGAKGVSDTFASALWALDTMFNFAKVGVQGVNFHMLPGSNYELFTPSQTASGTWQANVHPEYYGLTLFAQAFPPGAQLLNVKAPGGPDEGVGDEGRRRHDPRRRDQPGHDERARRGGDRAGSDDAGRDRVADGAVDQRHQRRLARRADVRRRDRHRDAPGPAATTAAIAGRGRLHDPGAARPAPRC